MDLEGLNSMYNGTISKFILANVSAIVYPASHLPSPSSPLSSSTLLKLTGFLLLLSEEKEGRATMSNVVNKVKGAIVLCLASSKHLKV